MASQTIKVTDGGIQTYRFGTMLGVAGSVDDVIEHLETVIDQIHMMSEGADPDDRVWVLYKMQGDECYIATTVGGLT